jgi:protease-4
MKSLQKDIKSNRPLLIQAASALSHLEAVSEVQLPAGAKVSEMTDVLEAIFGPKGVIEKFPPYAIIPLKGVIGRCLPEMETYCGSCDLEDVEEMLEDAVRDDAVKVIILAVDSPGGVSVGVPEFARRIRNCPKRVIAFTESEACSAAFWIASQASEFFATPSSSVGSVGCYIAYLNSSEAYRKDGYRMEVYKSGALKGAGIDGTDLTEDQKKMLTDQTVEIHTDFKDDVKAVRSFVQDSDMEGQIFSGKVAAAKGLVTGLVNGFDELMEKLNPEVAAQMEADEENDANAAAEPKQEETASARALSGLKFNTAAKAPKADDEMGEDDEDEKKKEDEDKVKAGRRVDPNNPDNDDDDDRQDSRKGKAEEDEDAGEEEATKSKDEDGEEGAPAQPKADGEEEDEKDEKKEGDEGKEKAEDESDDSDDAVDTDEKHDRNGTKRNRSKGIA